MKNLSSWVIVAVLLLVVGGVYALTVTTPIAPEGPQIVGGTMGAKEEISQNPTVTSNDTFGLLHPPHVGASAPNFTATDEAGEPLTLASFKGKKNVVLVFYQGSFCSVCGAQLENLQSHLSDFKNQDTQIIGVSADDQQHAAQSVGEHGLTFPLIPDAQKKLINEFGVANIAKGSLAWPSLFIIDKKGIVQLSYADHDGHRLHSNEILPVLSKLTGKPAPQLDYDH